MRIAIFTDIHGNLHALDAILEDIERQKPDWVASAGDLVGCSPYPNSPQVWRRLSELSIPRLLGNQEDFMLTCHSPEPTPLIQTSLQFRPTQLVAQQFEPQDIAEMRLLPMNITLDAPGGSVLLCHASPHDLNRSFAQGIDADMAAALEQVEAKTIVGGHLHRQWQGRWKDKLLILAGGGGLPLQGEHIAEYLLMTWRSGEWQSEYRTLPYDFQTAIDSIFAWDFLQEAGPVGWLMVAEALTQRDHLLPFFQRHCPDPPPENLEAWGEAVCRYLRQADRWQELSRIIEGCK